MRHSWVFGLLAAAVAVAAACEDPGASGTFSPRTKKSPTPKTSGSKDPCKDQGGNGIGGRITGGRSGLIFEKVDFKTSPADREITLLNIADKCDPAIDTSKHVIAYEFPSTDGEGQATTSIRFLRIGNKTVPGELRLAVKDNATDLVQDPGLDATSTSLGLLPSAGALALFKNVTASSDFNLDNLSDYVQWGAPATVSYRFADIAIKGFESKAWDDVTKFASSSTEPGKVLSIVSSASFGSTNWELK